MGQSGFADNFIKGMLGWIRGLASSIAKMFQSTGSGSSSGTSLINWFGQNWLWLLLSLIVLGIVVDWVVWMLRWRPYWLWFRKRRIVLDDDIDETMSERELDERYSARVRAARFTSSALTRDDPYDAYDEYYGYDDADSGYTEDEDADGYDDGYGEDEDYEADYADDDAGYDGDETYEGEMDEPDEGGNEIADMDGPGMDGDADFEDDFEEVSQTGNAFSSFDEAWDDAPKKPKRVKKKGLFGLRRAKKEAEDPFAVDEALLNLDDDFYSVVSEEPVYRQGDLSMLEYEDERAPYKLAPLDDEAEDGDYDERIGYRSSFEPKTGTASSRKSRRQAREDDIESPI